MKHDIDSIIKHFEFKGDFVEAKPYGSGHINDTYCLWFRNGDQECHRYILQRINHHVFKEPEKVMQNFAAITDHLRKKIIKAGGDPGRETLNLISTIDGKSLCRTREGDYWRALVFINGAVTYDRVDNAGHFYNAGKALGKFQKLLDDFDAKSLHETIPNFHDTEKRFRDFVEAVENDAVNRAAWVKNEIGFVLKRQEDCSVIVSMLKSGILPLRVTHNDTKFNNVMLDVQTGEGICLIDLDTVMPGSYLYDFGDSIRFGANTADEDEKDLSKVRMDLELYESYTRGYLESVRDLLVSAELEYLPFSAKIMTLECGIRFLTDYLNGDTYFKIDREEHNLDRARTQFKLVAEMEEKMEQMKRITEKNS